MSSIRLRAAFEIRQPIHQDSAQRKAAYEQAATALGKWLMETHDHPNKWPMRIKIITGEYAEPRENFICAKLYEDHDIDPNLLYK